MGCINISRVRKGLRKSLRKKGGYVICICYGGRIVERFVVQKNKNLDGKGGGASKTN